MICLYNFFLKFLRNLVLIKKNLLGHFNYHKQVNSSCSTLVFCQVLIQSTQTWLYHVINYYNLCFLWLLLCVLNLRYYRMRNVIKYFVVIYFPIKQFTLGTLMYFNDFYVYIYNTIRMLNVFHFARFQHARSPAICADA